MELKYVFTLKEFIEDFKSITLDPYTTTTYTIDQLLAGIYDKAPIYKTGTTLKDYIADLWTAVYARFANANAYDCAGEHVSSDEYRDFWLNFLNIVNNTYDKYATILACFDGQKTRLLDKIESTSKVKTGFNDTPQSEGTYTDATHRSTYQEVDNTTATEGTTPMERLNEIQNKLRDTMLEWTNEFRRLFWYE